MPISNDQIDAQIRKGQKLKNSPPSILPALPVRQPGGVAEFLFNALTGASAGVRSAQQAGGDPIAAFILGAGGATGAPRAGDIVAEARLKALESAPIGEISPDVTARFKLDPNTPLGIVRHLVPILQRSMELEDEITLIKARGEEARKTAALEEKTGKPTQGEFVARAYADKARQSDQALSKLILSGFDPAAINVAFQAHLPNIAKTGNVQQSEQALRQFVNAVLRRESGAAIPPSELENYRKQYWPSPGDSKETLLQKQKSRKLAIAGLEAEGSRIKSELQTESDPLGLDPLGLLR